MARLLSTPAMAPVLSDSAIIELVSTHQLASLDPEDRKQTARVCVQACKALENAIWLLENRSEHPVVQRTVVLFLGQQAIDKMKLVGKAQAVVSELAHMRIDEIHEQYTPEFLLKRKKTALNVSKHLTIRFAKEDRSIRNTDGSSNSPAATALRGFNMITIRPAAFKKSEGKFVRSRRLLHDVQIPMYQRADLLFVNLPNIIIHKSTHYILSTVDVCIEDSNLSPGFETKHSGGKRDPKTGKLMVYGFHCCRMLADSPQYLDALKNADSIAGMVVFLGYMWRNPDVDISNGYAKKMKGSALRSSLDIAELGCDRPVIKKE